MWNCQCCFTAAGEICIGGQRDLADEWLIPQTTGQVNDLSDHPAHGKESERTEIQEIAVSSKKQTNQRYSLPLWSLMVKYSDSLSECSTCSPITSCIQVKFDIFVPKCSPTCLMMPYKQTGELQERNYLHCFISFSFSLITNLCPPCCSDAIWFLLYISSFTL